MPVRRLGPRGFRYIPCSWPVSPMRASCFSAASLAELYFGVERLPEGKRRQRLHDWLQEDVAERFRRA